MTECKIDCNLYMRKEIENENKKDDALSTIASRKNEKKTDKCIYGTVGNYVRESIRYLHCFLLVYDCSTCYTLDHEIDRLKYSFDRGHYSIIDHQKKRLLVLYLFILRKQILYIFFSFKLNYNKKRRNNKEN